MDPVMNKRLVSALLAYAVLAGIAWRVLSGKILYAVLILFGGLAAKAIIVTKAGWRPGPSGDKPL